MHVSPFWVGMVPIAIDIFLGCSIQRATRQGVVNGNAGKDIEALSESQAFKY